MTFDLTDLIEMVKVAEQPSRALDWAIHCRNGLWGVGSYGSHPAYTASLDAALSLVPKDHDWIVANVNGGMGGTPYACVGSTKEHFGGTAILSLCLASLRAEAALATNLLSTEK
jgi:hypothetical protein